MKQYHAFGFGGEESFVHKTAAEACLSYGICNCESGDIAAARIARQEIGALLGEGIFHRSPDPAYRDGADRQIAVKEAQAIISADPVADRVDALAQGFQRVVRDPRFFSVMNHSLPHKIPDGACVGRLSSSEYVWIISH